ncbi:MAG: PAS domain-containing protein, partial [bacterium]|nr:PAS domain-containing protein [bacterium]
MKAKKPTAKGSTTTQGKYSSRLSRKAESRSHHDFRVDDDFYKNVIESFEDYAVFTTDKKGIISSWNSGAHKLLQYSEKEIIGKNIAIIFTPQDRKLGKHTEELGTALKKGRAIDERYHVRKDKSQFWGSGLVFPLKDEKGTVRGFAKVMRDLTLQQTVEIEQKRLLNVFEHAPAFICIVRGKDHVFELANNYYHQLVGHRKLIGKPACEALPEMVEQGFIKLLDT